MIPVCCGRGLIYGCCGDPDPQPEGCDDCQATGFIKNKMSRNFIQANTVVEHPIDDKDIIEVGKQIGATHVLIMWDGEYYDESKTVYSFHKPENVVYLMPIANREIEWAQERLEHSGMVLKTMEITQ